MNADRFSPVPRTISCYDLALQHTLPTHPQDLLLAACLREPPVASAAWRDFVAVVGDAKRFFERNGTGLKGLLPFVESRLAEQRNRCGQEFPYLCPRRVGTRGAAKSDLSGDPGRRSERVQQERSIQRAVEGWCSFGNRVPATVPATQSCDRPVDQPGGDVACEQCARRGPVRP